MLLKRDVYSCLRNNNPNVELFWMKPSFARFSNSTNQAGDGMYQLVTSGEVIAKTAQQHITTKKSIKIVAGANGKMYKLYPDNTMQECYSTEMSVPKKERMRA
jgi:hypothetical protein